MNRNNVGGTAVLLLADCRLIKSVHQSTAGAQRQGSWPGLQAGEIQSGSRVNFSARVSEFPHRIRPQPRLQGMVQTDTMNS